MSGSAELLVLRLALLAVIFVFVVAVALTLRGGVAPRAAGSMIQAGRTWKLVVVSAGDSGLARGAAFALAGTMLIGRDGRAGIVLPDASVSTRHATIESSGGGCRVADLGSTNGTFVEGRRIGEAGATVAAGERLAIGNVVLQLRSD